MTHLIRYFLKNRIITAFLLLAVLLGGLATAPFNWHGGLLPRDSVALDFRQSPVRACGLRLENGRLLEKAASKDSLHQFLL